MAAALQFHRFRNPRRRRGGSLTPGEFVSLCDEINREFENECMKIARLEVAAKYGEYTSRLDSGRA